MFVNHIKIQSMRLFVICFLVGLGFSSLGAQGRWKTTDGVVAFKSDAPLELIEARSNKLQGLLDLQQRTFAFSLPVASFEGFNTPLQKEHFNENYLESRRFPKATFSGRLIENTDLSVDGVYDIRAKGALSIHGISLERIIKATVRVENGRLTVQSNFTVLLAEHGITIPKVVHQKIAEEIQVQIKATFLSERL